MRPAARVPDEAPPAPPAPLIDALLGADEADATEYHATRVRAPAPVVWEALWQADIGGRVAQALFALRALPAALAGSRDARARLNVRGPRPALTLAGIARGSFVVLGERAGNDVVLGVTGRFWRPNAVVLSTDPRRWGAGPPAGAAQGAWSFTLTPQSPTETLLATETRVRCADAAARRAFRAYWLVVRPFSGLLRRLMLRAVRREAERRVAAER